MRKGQVVRESAVGIGTETETGISAERGTTPVIVETVGSMEAVVGVKLDEKGEDEILFRMDGFLLSGSNQ